MTRSEIIDTDRADWLTPEAEDLAKAFLRLEKPDEAAAFLRDLCTHRELAELAARWQAVRLLDSGMAYREVAERTGMSTTTVTRVSHWLHHGTGGYRTVLDRTAKS